MAWIIPDSTNLVASSDCGETINTWEDMLNQVNPVIHLVSEVHYFELDLGASYDITRFGFRGDTSGGGSGFAPTDMDVFVSTDGSTWGTAVLTGVDTSSYTAGAAGIFESTQKTGRYLRFEINGTSGGSPSFVSWGASGRAMIEVWEGDIPIKYKTVIPLKFSYNNNFSTTYTPTTGQYGLIPWDGSKYNNIISAYLVGTGKRTGTSGADPNPRWFLELYDRTNATAIGEVVGTGTAYETAISSDVSANLPSGSAVFDVRWKQLDSTSSQTMNFELHIIQESEASGNKTCVYVPLASYHTNLSATSKFHPNPYRVGEYPSTSPTSHQFKYVASQWDCTIDKFYFSTTLRANTGNTVTAYLNDVSYGTPLATHTNATTTYTQESSADIKSSLVDGTTYEAFVKSTATNNAGDIISNAYGIFEISDMDGFPTFQDVGILGKYQSGSTSGWLEDTSQQVQILDNDTTYFSSGITRTYKHQTVLTMGAIGNTSMNSSLYDDGTRNSTADLSETSGSVNSFAWYESSAITPADASAITLGYNLDGTGTGKVASSVLITYLSGLGLAPVTSTRNRYHAM